MGGKVDTIRLGWLQWIHSPSNRQVLGILLVEEKREMCCLSGRRTLGSAEKECVDTAKATDDNSLDQLEFLTHCYTDSLSLLFHWR